MSCKQFTEVLACFTAPDGTKKTVTKVIEFGKDAVDGKIKPLKVRYTDGDVYSITVPDDAIELGPCCCESYDVKEHYLCLGGVKTPVWVSLNSDTLQVNNVINTLTMEIVDEAEYQDGFTNPCGDCQIAACLRFEGFDGYFTEDEAVVPGQTKEFEILLNGQSLSTLILDYTSTSDNTNKSTWYLDLVNYVNNNTNFTMSVNTDVPVLDVGKVLWNLEYEGQGSEELVIISTGDGLDYYRFNVDDQGVISGSITDDNGDEFFTRPIIESCE